MNILVLAIDKLSLVLIITFMYMYTSMTGKWIRCMLQLEHDKTDFKREKIALMCNWFKKSVVKKFGNTTN